MANYQTSQDLVQAVLNVSGELTDGTSGYQADALTYLNLAYKGVLTGGNIYGMDVAEPWSWAVAKNPIVITLQPSVQASVNCTYGSNQFTFPVVPTDLYGNALNLTNWWINLNGQDEWYQVRSYQTGMLATATVDSNYPMATGLSTCTLALLDYNLTDDSILIDNSNPLMDFTETNGQTIRIVVQPGYYTPLAFIAAVVAQMSANTTNGSFYSGNWNSITRTFSITNNQPFTFLCASGTPMNFSRQLGLELLDTTSGPGAFGFGQALNSVYPLNAINRLTAPMVCYRKTDNSRSAQSEGKIFELSYNTFVRDYPMTMLNQGMPDKFCIVTQSSTGIVSIRFNGYISDYPTKVEVGYIPKHRALQNNVASVPIVPEEHRKYLVDAAAAMLMEDKTDSKASARTDMAKAGLQALVHSCRKDKSLAGTDYAKLVPRAGQTKRRWWRSIT